MDARLKTEFPRNLYFLLSFFKDYFDHLLVSKFAKLLFRVSHDTRQRKACYRELNGGQIISINPECGRKSSIH